MTLNEYNLFAYTHMHSFSAYKRHKNDELVWYTRIYHISDG